MSASGNFGQHPSIYYSPFEAGGSDGQNRPSVKDERDFFAAPRSETEQHLQRAHDLLARLRQAVRGAR